MRFPTVLLSAAAVASVIGASAWYLDASPSGSKSGMTGAIPSASSSRFVSSKEWAELGKSRAEGFARNENQRQAALAQAKVLPNESGRIPVASPPSPVSYLTQPIDITQNGTYVFRAIVPASFVLPDSGGFAPPPDVTFTLQKIDVPHATVTPDGKGQAVLALPITVANLTAPYPGFQIWIEL